MIPAFRITNEAIQKDIALMEKYGRGGPLRRPAPSVAELKAMGYTHILYAVGAWKPGQLGIPGDVAGAIQWMKGRQGREHLRGRCGRGGRRQHRHGCGPSGQAQRRPDHVTIVYRRTKNICPPTSMSWRWRWRTA